MKSKAIISIIHKRYEYRKYTVTCDAENKNIFDEKYLSKVSEYMKIKKKKNETASAPAME